MSFSSSPWPSSQIPACRRISQREFLAVSRREFLSQILKLGVALPAANGIMQAFANPQLSCSAPPPTPGHLAPEDEPLLIRLHQALSERSVYMRYFSPLKLSHRTAHERLTRICFIDYDREIALVVERKTETGPEIIAIGRLSKLRGRNEAELAVLVDDRYQHLGMGSELYRRMVGVARDEKLQRVVSVILVENVDMLAIVRKLGFHLQPEMEDDTVKAELKL